MKNIIQSVKGSRDFYPEDKAVQNWLYQIIEGISTSFGYQEYDGPFLEKIDLYAAKSGEELVKEQAFVFQDRGGEMITLRPELTLSLARMVAQKQNELTFPLRWWSFGPFWRYERPQKGRSREFFQWNIDLVGVNAPEADAELIAICAEFFKKVGITSDQVMIRVNDRRLMVEQLAEIDIVGGVKDAAYKLIDRCDKLAPDVWNGFGLELGFTESQVDGLKRILEEDMSWKKSPHLARIFEVLAAMGYMNYVRYDPRVVRGLDYYTGTVFEANDQDGGRSILGGGHYDNLVADVGGDPLPGVGFAMGDMMSTLVTQKYGRIPAMLAYSNIGLITIFDDTSVVDAYRLSSDLRTAGFDVICYPAPAKLPKQLKYADRLGVRYVVIVGPDEVAAGKVAVKDLLVGKQHLFDRAQLAGQIKNMLDDQGQV